MEGRSWHGGEEPCGRRVDFRRGAQDPEVSKATFVCEEKVKRREAGLNGQDVSGGRHKSVCRPPLNHVPEQGELPYHVDSGHEDVRPVAEDWEKEGGGQFVAEKGREADARGRDSFDRHKGCLGLGKSFDEVGGGRKRGSEPVAEPSDLRFGWENRTIQVDRRVGYGVSVPGRAPMDEFCFGDRETNT